MPPIDPDAPWWANLAMLVVVLAGVPALTAWIAGRKGRHTLREVAEDARRTRDQLENEHAAAAHPNLRDDLDAKVAGIRQSIGLLADAQEAVRGDVVGLRSEMHDIRRDLTDLRAETRRNHRDLAGLRTTVPALVEVAVAERADACPLRGHASPTR